MSDNSAEHLMALVESLNPIIEMSIGFKNRLLAEGFTEEDASEAAGIVLKMTLRMVAKGTAEDTGVDDEDADI